MPPAAGMAHDDERRSRRAAPAPRRVRESRCEQAGSSRAGARPRGSATSAHCVPTRPMFEAQNGSDTVPNDGAPVPRLPARGSPTPQPGGSTSARLPGSGVARKVANGPMSSDVAKPRSNSRSRRSLRRARGAAGGPGRRGHARRGARLDLYERMALIRVFEEEVERQYKRARIGGYCHLASGQEGATVGAVHPLRRGRRALLLLPHARLRARSRRRSRRGDGRAVRPRGRLRPRPRRLDAPARRLARISSAAGASSPVSCRSPSARRSRSRTRASRTRCCASSATAP